MDDSSLASQATARLLRDRASAGSIWLPVSGRSMWPTIKPPAEVLVVPRDRPRLGEVWAFVAAGGSIVVHRYDRRAGDRFQFRGDGSATADHPVPSAVLIGRVVNVHDCNGRRRLGVADQVSGVLRINSLRLLRLVRRGLWAIRTMGRQR